VSFCNSLPDFPGFAQAWLSAVNSLWPKFLHSCASVPHYTQNENPDSVRVLILLGQSACLELATPSFFITQLYQL
jgi:hypothetical protein